MTNPTRDAIDQLLKGQPNIMTAKQLGFVLGISHKTVYAKTDKGEIPYLPVAGKRYLKQDIIEWLQSRYYRPRPWPPHKQNGQ